MSHYSAGQAIDSLGFGRFQVSATYFIDCFSSSLTANKINVHNSRPSQIYLSVMVGFAYMADAMEMMILSILGPALHCEWHITGKRDFAFGDTVWASR